MPVPAIAGFVGAWALFHSVLPQVRGQFTSESIRQAAYRVDEPEYTSINGGGIKFVAEGVNTGQNLRAPSVVGQWQAVNEMRVVYPAAFATASPQLT